jgi:hypothetical protein
VRSNLQVAKQVELFWAAVRCHWPNLRPKEGSAAVAVTADVIEAVSAARARALEQLAATGAVEKVPASSAWMGDAQLASTIAGAS